MQRQTVHPVEVQIEIDRFDLRRKWIIERLVLLFGQDHRHVVTELVSQVVGLERQYPFHAARKMEPGNQIYDFFCHLCRL